MMPASDIDPTTRRRRPMCSFIDGSTPMAHDCTGLTPIPRRPKKHGRICNRGRRRRARRVGARLIGTSCRGTLHPAHCLPSSRAARRMGYQFRRSTFFGVPRAPRPRRAVNGSTPRSCRAWSAVARGILPKSGPNRARHSAWSTLTAWVHSFATPAPSWATRSSVIAPTPIGTAPIVRACLEPRSSARHRSLCIVVRSSRRLSETPAMRRSPTRWSPLSAPSRRRT